MLDELRDHRTLTEHTVSSPYRCLSYLHVHASPVMPAPRPPVELKGHCSVINNNTLYVYSPEAFQALPLQEGGKWQQLPMGVAVTGASCIRAAPNTNASDAALWVVGGSTNSSEADYSGLQRYSFADNRWQTISPKVPVTQNRQHHGAAYLNHTESILVYAGSQLGASANSSQTFLISTSPPYNVDAYSSTAPPVISPMIMPWNDSHAVMVGGGAQNRQVFTFGPAEGWQDLGTTLLQGIDDQSTMRSTLVTGDDGSKVLEIYNTGISPNEVAQIVLTNPDGSPASPGTTLDRTPSRKRKRALALNSWPTYNDTLAPRTTRPGCSVAQDASGRAVISGGNADDPLDIFDQRQNTWVNTTAFFGGQAVVVSSSSTPSSLPSGSTTSAVSSTSSSVAPAALPTGSGNPRHRMLTVLGATLGTIFGIAFLVILLLFLIKWRRSRRKRAGEKEYVNEKEGRLSFADRGAEFMHEAGGSVGQNYSASMNHSVASLAIMQGKTGQGHKRGLDGSDDSTLPLSQHKSPIGVNDPLELRYMSEKTPSAFLPIPAPLPAKLAARNEPSPPSAAVDSSPITVAINTAQPPTAEDHRSRSSGWSRYFADNDATNLATMPASGRTTYDSQASLSSSEASHSQYTESQRHPSTGTQHQIRPLELNLGGRFDAERFSRVASGSPTLALASGSRDDVSLGAERDVPPEVARALRTGVATEVAKVVNLSRVSSASSLARLHGSTTTTTVGGGGGNTTATGWTSVPPSPLSASRPASHGARVGSGLFVDDRASGYVPRSNGSGGGPMWHQRLQGTPPPPPSPGLPKKGGLGEEMTGRESTVTVFPSGVEAGEGEREREEAGGKKVPQGQEDMSWLNLGNGAV